MPALQPSRPLDYPGATPGSLCLAWPEGSPARVYLEQIQRTREEASAITKQLLAFSGKQVVEFRPTNLHASLSDSEFMLPRLLGSDIGLTFRHEATEPWILSDDSQVEQIVANLAINARDAMRGGGRLTIATRNVPSLPEDVAETSTSEGNWVVLEVSDTGTGMDERTGAQIFEPFFISKPTAKAPGLVSLPFTESFAKAAAISAWNRR